MVVIQPSCARGGWAVAAMAMAMTARASDAEVRAAEIKRAGLMVVEDAKSDDVGARRRCDGEYVACPRLHARAGTTA